MSGIYFGKFLVIIFFPLFSVLFFLSYLSIILITYALDYWYCPTALLFIFFTLFFFLCFSLVIFNKHIFTFTKVFLGSIKSTDKLVKAFYISVTGFLISSIFVWFFSYSFHLCWNSYLIDHIPKTQGHGDWLRLRLNKNREHLPHPTPNLYCQLISIKQLVTC